MLTRLCSHVSGIRYYAGFSRNFFKRFKGVKLYEIIDTINAEYGVNLQKETLEPVYRAEVARLFDSELEVIPGAAALLDAVKIPMCVVSNGPVGKNAAFAR